MFNTFDSWFTILVGTEFEILYFVFQSELFEDDKYFLC